MLWYVLSPCRDRYRARAAVVPGKHLHDLRSFVGGSRPRDCACASRPSLPTLVHVSQDPSDKPSDPPPAATWSDVGIGALNGVLGDYLHTRGNDLAVEMTAIVRNVPVASSPDALAQAYPKATERIVVLLHGLCCTESTWLFPGSKDDSYGSRMHRDFGFTPVFVRYNTGRHISENGRGFCGLLHDLASHWPAEVEEIALVGHSMGGLVARSACLYAARLERPWLGKVKRAFYIGSPHLGAPLEKVGNVASAILGKVPDPVTRLVRDLINLRSTGIKDLRYANLVDEDWVGRNPDAVLENHRTHTPLSERVEHFVVAGTLTAQEKHVIGQMVGDALVRVPSATGRPERGGHGLGLPDDHVRLFPGLHHMTLAHHGAVYEQLAAWMRA